MHQCLKWAFTELGNWEYQEEGARRQCDLLIDCSVNT